MARVIISSGHSSSNPGSVANGLREVDVARQIAKASLKYLRNCGIISLSVPPEMELLQRIEWINKSGYIANTNDVAIEIHINDGGKSGIEAWFEGEGMNASETLTRYIVEEVVTQTGLENQGAKSEYKHEIGSIAFLHETNPIGSLIECGYIDNPKDAEFLRDPKNIELLGKGIAKGLCRFLNVEYKELPAQPVQGKIPNTIQSQNPVTPINQQYFQQNIQSNTQLAGNMNQPIDQQSRMNHSSQTNYSQPTYVQTQNTTVNNIPAGVKATTTQQAQSMPTSTTNITNDNTYKPLPSREERKEMINNLYIKVLGHEPSQNDLNYFLNIGVREDELLKRMLDSQEHIDIIKAKSELASIKDKYNNIQSEILILRTQTDDQKKIIEGLNYSIMQKNNAIYQYQAGINQLQTKPNTPLDQSKSKKNQPRYKGTFLDRLFKAFSDVFE